MSASAHPATGAATGRVFPPHLKLNKIRREAIKEVNVQNFDVEDFTGILDLAYRAALERRDINSNLLYQHGFQKKPSIKDAAEEAARFISSFVDDEAYEFDWDVDNEALGSLRIYAAEIFLSNVYPDLFMHSIDLPVGSDENHYLVKSEIHPFISQTPLLSHLERYDEADENAITENPLTATAAAVVFNHQLPSGWFDRACLLLRDVFDMFLYVQMDLIEDDVEHGQRPDMTVGALFLELLTNRTLIKLRTAIHAYELESVATEADEPPKTLEEIIGMTPENIDYYGPEDTAITREKFKTVQYYPRSEMARVMGGIFRREIQARADTEMYTNVNVQRALINRTSALRDPVQSIVAQFIRGVSVDTDRSDHVNRKRYLNRIAMIALSAGDKTLPEQDRAFREIEESLRMVRYHSAVTLPPAAAAAAYSSSSSASAAAASSSSSSSNDAERSHKRTRYTKGKRLLIY